MSDLATALEALDTTNDEHWTDQGLPRLSVLKELVQGTVTRDDINRVAPGFCRDKTDAHPTVDSTPVDQVDEKAEVKRLMSEASERVNQAQREYIELVKRMDNIILAEESKRDPSGSAHAVKAYQAAQAEQRAKRHQMAAAASGVLSNIKTKF